MKVVSHNRKAWNRQSRQGSPWCEPVSSGEIDAARNGDWRVILTPNRSVPVEWIGEAKDREVLCLASGGGQQAPVLAAAGARVTSFDNSDEQLAKDRMVAERHSLQVETVLGDMADLSVFADESFDIIFHPVSNCFVENLTPVWSECHRVLRHGGRLLSGFMNPMFFMFDQEEAHQTGVLQVKYSMPFSTLTSLSDEERAREIEEESPLEFGHTLEAQIGGQIKAGFSICGFYEDDWNDEATLMNKFGSIFVATLAVKRKNQ